MQDTRYKILIAAIFFILISLPIFAVSLDEANLLYSQGKYSQAETIYKELAEKDITLIPEYVCFLKEQGKYNQTYPYLDKYLEKYRSDDLVRLIYAQILYYDGFSDKALEQLREIKEIERKYQYLTNLLYGLIFEDSGKIEKAVSFYKESLSLRKTSVSLYRLAKLFYNNKDYDKAIGYFSSLILYDPSFRLAHFYLAKAYGEKKDHKRSYSHLVKAQKFYPENKEIKAGIESVRKELGEQYFIKKRKALSERRKKVFFPRYIRPEKVETIPEVRIGIVQDASKCAFKCNDDFKIILDDGKEIKLERDRFYMLEAKDGKLVLKKHLDDNKDDDFIAFVKTPLRVKSENFPFYVIGVKHGKDEFWQKSIDTAYRGDLEIISGAGNNSFTVVNIVSIEEYVYGVLPSEMYHSYDIQALKAQAVCARTIAYRNRGRHKKQGFDFCPGTHCQVYKGLSVEKKKTNYAVIQTRGQIMFSQDKAIEPFFHANCGGCIRSDAFGKEDFLAYRLDRIKNDNAVFSPFKAYKWFLTCPDTFSARTSKKSKYRWQRVYDFNDFEIVFGKPLTDLKNIFIDKTKQCENVTSLTMQFDKNVNIEGSLNVRRYFDNLRSSSFKVDLKYKNSKDKKIDKIFIWGAGFGHGSGMSQEGAAYMAKKGFDYQKILQHYYNHIDIKTIY